MSDSDFCQLTTKDYTTIEVLLERYAGRDDTMAAILRQKIAKAVVMFRDDIPSNVVTLDSRVTFRVDGGPAETRIIANDETRGVVGMVLAITTPRGVALLGLAEGDCVTITKEDGSRETLSVQEVVYQPEAAARDAGKLGQRGAPDAARRPFLRVVHSSDDLPQKPAPAGKAAFRTRFEDPDYDPDPTAA